MLDGDKEKTIEVGKELVKTLAVSALAVGMFDLVDGFDDVIDVDDVNNVDIATDIDTYETDNILLDNSDTHHVTPHYRTLANGSEIWIDGDGDTSIDTFEGWEQSNPDFKA